MAPRGWRYPAAFAAVLVLSQAGVTLWLRSQPEVPAAPAWSPRADAPGSRGGPPAGDAPHPGGAPPSGDAGAPDGQTWGWGPEGAPDLPEGAGPNPVVELDTRLASDLIPQALARGLPPDDLLPSPDLRRAAITSGSLESEATVTLVAAYEAAKARLTVGE
ncbi:MAG: hypothetical protein ABIO70_07880 [Pseudomonadota bacterium]